MSEQQEKPSVADYWKKPPSEQSKIREQIQPPAQPSRCITYRMELTTDGSIAIWEKKQPIQFSCV
jgi:hypothetical protein